jgi:hypothetical protein
MIAAHALVNSSSRGQLAAAKPEFRSNGFEADPAFRSGLSDSSYQSDANPLV